VGKETGKLIIALGLGGAALLLLRARSKNVGSTAAIKNQVLIPRGAKSEMQITPNFKLSEFLHSTKLPELAWYKPTAGELQALIRLCLLVLEPLRGIFGPIQITGGARPTNVRDSQGRNLSDLLATDSRNPGASKTSDHIWFGAADIVVPSAKTVSDYKKVWETLKANPNVRQVLLELSSAPGGKVVIHHIHVSVVGGGHDRIAEPNFAFVSVDGKTLSAAQGAAVV
jgi:hypothetical protein